jgi:hypothetical protein
MFDIEFNYIFRNIKVDYYDHIWIRNSIPNDIPTNLSWQNQVFANNKYFTLDDLEVLDLYLLLTFWNKSNILYNHRRQEVDVIS